MGRMQDDMKPVMQSTIDMFNEQLKDYENPESETIVSMAGYEKMSYEFNMGEYQEKINCWEEEWPADPDATREEKIAGITGPHERCGLWCSFKRWDTEERKYS
jgi:hypothetical protein